MARFYALDPEVPGGMGVRTVITNRAELGAGASGIPQVAVLELVLDGWMGDDLLQTYPCYVVTAQLAAAIGAAGLSGAVFEEVLVSASEQYTMVQAAGRLPTEMPLLGRLVPTGEAVSDGQAVKAWSGDDFCFCAATRTLIVSDRAFALLSRHQIRHCDATELADRT